MNNNKKSWKIEGQNLPPDLVAEFKQHLQNSKKALDALPRPLAPPWQQFPTYSRTSMGWRMGAGETYMVYFREWFINLPENERKVFIQQTPAPSDWVGWFETIVD